jgi:N-acetylglucosamine-6-phosphate deacetylase
MSNAKIEGLDPLSGRTVCVTVEDGVVARIEETRGDTDLYLSAGFVDLQVNGRSGFDLNAEQISVETVLGLVDAMLANGVTSFLPTLITAPEERICRSLKVIAEARKIHRKVAACVPFVHIEGPSISPINGYRGAHAVDAIRPPSIEEFGRWQEAGGGIVGMVTLSPHFSESVEYIEALVRRGIHVAIGHTHASSEEISRAVDAGAKLSTHLGNGIAQEIPRHRNPIWSQLADDRLKATFIADGHHLPHDILKVMLRAKGIARSVLVSDSVGLAGMPAGTYTTAVGGVVELHPDGRLCMRSSDLLAGSTASLAHCIGHAVRVAGVSLKDALTMATVNPGRFAGGRGQLSLGSRADFVRFRWKDGVIIEDVWLAGERVHAAGS